MRADLELLTPPEVGKILRIDPESVRAIIRRGELQASNLAQPGSRRPRWRISRAAVEAFLAGRAAQPPAPAVKRRRRADERVIEFY